MQIMFIVILQILEKALVFTYSSELLIIVYANIYKLLNITLMLHWQGAPFSERDIEYVLEKWYKLSTSRWILK